MLATIHSKIVDLDELIPRPVDIQREDNDVQRLIPPVFQAADIVQEEDVIDSVDEASRFFDNLFSYFIDLEAKKVVTDHTSNNTGLTNALAPIEKITLPKKNWKVSKRGYFNHFIGFQSLTLRMLMRFIYNNVEGIKDPTINFTLSPFKLKYQIGTERCVARLEGAVTWFYEQTWSEFLGETLSVMLGQLAKNISSQRGSTGDQEVFVIGFHDLSLHIARAFFTKDMISRVHLNGCSENEIFELKFTRSYNLFLKKDWLEATRVLARLFRYLRSGSAKVGAIQAGIFDKKNNTAD